MNINEINTRQAVITTKEILAGESIITDVIVDEDGDLQFIGKSGASEETAKVVSLEQIMRLDPSLNWLENLDIDTRYQRTANQEWIATKR